MQYVIVDHENTQVFGPFDSELAAAKAAAQDGSFLPFDTEYREQNGILEEPPVEGIGWTITELLPLVVKPTS